VAFSLLRPEEGRDAANLHPQEWLAPARAVRAARNPVPSAEENGAIQHALEQPLAVGPGPITTAGRDLRTSAPPPTNATAAQ
jgi:hypothetical protein